jgi:Predicted phosphosugar isomerases
MFAHRLMYRNGEFKDYERFYKELDAHLADAFVDTSKRADAFALAFAEKHKDDPLHYYVSAGNHFGANYSYAMCYVEEQHWIRSKSIHASEFFHGTLEVIDRDTNVTVFVGEDEERPLAERVARFLPRICARYTIIDTKDYPLKGISPEFRGLISYLVCHAVTERIDAHIEKLNCHPMDIRRYYRRLDY